MKFLCSKCTKHVSGLNFAQDPTEGC